MLKIFKSEKLFIIFLWLIALHSFIVGILLIVLPPDIMQFFGFQIHERFFQTQGGVFHLVLCIAYILITTNILENKNLTIFSISAKIIATIFLSSYYLFVSPIITVFLSGIGDFLMAIIIFLFYINIYKSK
jgi:hypothetical protein